MSIIFFTWGVMRQSILCTCGNFLLELDNSKLFNLSSRPLLGSSQLDMQISMQSSQASMQKCCREAQPDKNPQVHKSLKIRHYNEPVTKLKIQDLSVKKFAMNTEK